MIVLAYVFGSQLTPFVAYVSTIVAYWCVCWILYFLYTPKPVPAVKTRRTHSLLNVLPFVPLAGIAYVAFSKQIELPTPSVLATIVTLALVNGFTEEMYWRKLYADNFYDNFSCGFAIPCILFSFWHVALLAIPGVLYEGGAPALVGGAAVLGVIWGLSYWYNKNVWIISSAHSLVNVVAFTMLASDNNWIGG